MAMTSLSLPLSKSPLSRTRSDSSHYKKDAKKVVDPLISPTIGFTFRPYLVRESYFCEHDSQEDKVSTYITWVNNQLARRSDTQCITSLERGISDGITLPQLLHILGDEPVPDAVLPPGSDAQRKQNIRLCFNYLQQRHIHPRNSTAPDVSNGNAKCIMRLLLALAANFKTYRPDTRGVRYASIDAPVCNGVSIPATQGCKDASLIENVEMTWVYDQVVDTRKQLESLKHLLLKDITDDEKVLLDECGMEVSLPVSTSCSDVTDSALQEAIANRDKQIVELRAEALHLRTRDKFLTTELEDRNIQISKLKIILDRKQDNMDGKARDKVNMNKRTKILYYVGTSTTPYLSQSHKRLGDITLRDFKHIVNRSGRFRYNFKTFDREVGTVKQEVTEDGAPLPIWEGKIVGFVEELPPAHSLDHIEI